MCRVVLVVLCCVVSSVSGFGSALENLCSEELEMASLWQTASFFSSSLFFLFRLNFHASERTNQTDGWAGHVAHKMN